MCIFTSHNCYKAGVPALRDKQNHGLSPKTFKSQVQPPAVVEPPAVAAYRDSQVLRESPEAALALLQICTAVRAVGVGGRGRSTGMGMGMSPGVADLGGVQVGAAGGWFLFFLLFSRAKGHTLCFFFSW